MLQKGDKKIINSWAFYDWANSSYPLVITTAIFPLFYEKVTTTTVDGKESDMVSLFGLPFHNTEIYSYVVALSFVIVSISAPILSGIADYSGSKRKFMQFFCYLGSLSCASLYFFSSAHLGLGLLSILFASVGFWGSLVFYNAFLPEIAEPADHDRVSAKGYSLGYIGSAILLIGNLIAIKGLGMDAKWSFVSVAIWWAGFAQITFARLPDNIFGKKPEGNIIFKGL
jgi:UMF1 family MFS transporter